MCQIMGVSCEVAAGRTLRPCTGVALGRGPFSPHLLTNLLAAFDVIPAQPDPLPRTGRRSRNASCSRERPMPRQGSTNMASPYE